MADFGLAGGNLGVKVDFHSADLLVDTAGQGKRWFIFLTADGADCPLGVGCSVTFLVYQVQPLVVAGLAKDE